MSKSSQDRAVEKASLGEEATYTQAYDMVWEMTNLFWTWAMSKKKYSVGKRQVGLELQRRERLED